MHVVRPEAVRPDHDRACRRDLQERGRPRSRRLAHGIFKSPSQAQAWNRLVRPGPRCLSSVFEGGGSNAKSKTTVLSTGKLPLPVPGRRHAAYRIAADVATGGQHVKVYLDLIMQGRGPANAVMLVTSVLDPPSAVLEPRLATAVAGRLPR